MDTESCIAMCRSMAKAYSTGVRLFEKDFCVYYYSVSHILPDPLGPYLHQILDSGEEAGIITTPLYQFYGFLTLPGGQRMILGSTRMLQEDTRELKLMLAMLDVAPEAKRLLQFTDQELGEIAALLDYSSQSHFQTVFRKVTGETPMAYRRRTRPN